MEKKEDTPVSSFIGLADNILRTSGLTGLLVFLLTGFMMWVIYQGEQASTMLHQKIIDGQAEELSVLKDIRYAVQTNRNKDISSDYPLKR